MFLLLSPHLDFLVITEPIKIKLEFHVRNPVTAETLKIPVLCTNPFGLAIQQQT
jgi:hypothetical protein